MENKKTLKYTKCFKVHEEELTCITWELFIKYLNKNMEFCFNFNNMAIDIAFHYEGKKKVYELNISSEDKTTNLVFDSVDELIYFKAFNSKTLHEI